MTPAELVERLVAQVDQLSIADYRRLLDALVEPLRDLDVCAGNYVARGAQAIVDRQHARIAGSPAPL